MPKYRYNATDTTGKWISGEVEATSHDDASTQLRANGLIVESMIEADDRPVSGRLSRSELVELVEQLTSLTRSGVPLPTGLRAAGEEVLSPKLRFMLRSLAKKIESGASLEDALVSSGGFPADLRGLILAGSRSGRLADLLTEFVRGANLAAELRRMFWSTLLYPTLVLITVLIVVRLVCSIAIRSVDNILRDFGVDQPGSTLFLIALSRVIVDHGTEMLVALVVVPMALYGLFRLMNSPADRWRLICRIPLIGPILRYCALTNFCHRMAMLLEADLPLPLAFELAGSSVGDAEVADACQRMGHAVESGQPLSKAVRLWDAIPAGLGQLFHWSENQQSMPEALHLAGDLFESRARAQSRFATSVLSVVILLMIFSWIGFAVLALYLPMIQLIGRLAF